MASIFKNLPFLPFLNKNCVTCILWPPLFFDVSTIISFRCGHTSNETNKNFRVSKIRLIFSLLVACEQFSKTLEIYGEFHNESSMESKIVMIANSFFTISHVLLFIYNMVLGRRRVVVFQRTQALLNVCLELGITNMFTTAQAKSMRRRGLTYVLIGGVLCTSFLILLTKTNASSDWMDWMHDFGSIFASLALVLNFFQSLNEILLYRTFCAKFVNEVKKCTSKKIMSDDVLYTPIASFQKKTSSNFERDLKLVRRFLDNLFRLIVTINECYGLEMLMWYLFIIVLSIFNTYMFTLKLFRSDGLSVDDFGFLSRIIICTCISVFYTYKIQTVVDMGDEIVSYLFQYPIGNLSELEAEQMELLLMGLHVQKPIIKATDICKVETKLLAPICGTIVTYVLVGHQFYSSD